MAKWLREEIGDNADHLQFGNRRQVSTTHMLIELVHNWSKALNSGNIVNAIVIDFTKAFDKIDHNILLNKYENEKISPCLMKWLANFLLERQQSVKIGDIVSPTLR